MDGELVIDRWIDQAPTTYQTVLPLDGGPHLVVMEYYENGGGAEARLNYTQVDDPLPDPPYRAQFWNTPDATGVPSIPTRMPDLERDDETLDFDWRNDSPAAGIDPDKFVARWTKRIELSAGVYRFKGVRDDGIRVYIDDIPVVDQWNFGDVGYSVDKVVLSGEHDLRIDYFEGGGGARVDFSYERIAEARPIDGGYDAEYFDNRNLAGTPLLTRTDDAVDFDWGNGAPGDALPSDNFSVRWARTLSLDADAVYGFTVTGDDGVRLYVDDNKVLDKWILQGPTTYSVVRALGAGTHEIVLEYFEAGGGALARLHYEPTDQPPPPPPPSEPFSAEYFVNHTLSGVPVLARSDDAIDFDWGDGSPGAEVPANLFSARWTRTKHYAAGTYRFSVTGDDGIRVLVDGAEVVDGWFSQAPTTYSADVPLSDGEHTVVVEYFEGGGGAVARFSEAKLPDPPPYDARMLLGHP